MREIYGILRHTGITSRYKGYYFVSEAVTTILNSGNTPIMITKDIYPSIAKKYRTTPQSVESAIRTVVGISWQNHKKEVEELAGCTLNGRPTNREFLDIITYYIWQQR